MNREQQLSAALSDAQNMIHSYVARIAELEAQLAAVQQALDARKDRDNIFFLAGWNGCSQGLDAHEQFKKASIASQAKQGGAANGAE